MENLKIEDLEFVEKVVDHCYHRAKLKVIAKEGLLKSPYRKSIDFDDSKNGVSVELEENTRHDCPDTYCVTLTLDEIQMTEEQFDTVVEGIKAEKLEKEVKLEQVKKERKIEQKRQLFEKLKLEFDNPTTTSL